MSKLFFLRGIQNRLHKRRFLIDLKQINIKESILINVTFVGDDKLFKVIRISKF
jgi:hypothetical protein